MIKNLLFTKQHTSFLMENASFSQSGCIRNSPCLWGIEAFVNGEVAYIGMLATRVKTDDHTDTIVIN